MKILTLLYSKQNMKRNCMTIITVYCLFIIHLVDSAPWKLRKNEWNQNVNYYEEHSPRRNRDISFSFPSIGFRVKSPFPKPSIFGVLNQRRNEYLPAPQLSEMTNIIHSPRPNDAKPHTGDDVTVNIKSNDTTTKDKVEISSNDVLTTTSTVITADEFTTESSTTETELTTFDDNDLESRISPNVLASLTG